MQRSARQVLKRVLSHGSRSSIIRDVSSKAFVHDLTNQSTGFLRPHLLIRTSPYKIFGSPFSTSTTIPHVVHAASPTVSQALVLGGAIAQKQVSRWLYGCAGWVFAMVVLGGMTRLTRSGLSMTDWKFTGSLPPISAEQWQHEFDKYKQSPEYRIVNDGMSLEDFKFIYWMEYVHRMWGRSLGVIFILPFGYFATKGYLTRRLALRLTALFAMGGAQGLVGWWMVKSGLEDPSSESTEPRVSPYRLAAHLTSAFVIYSGLLWTAMSAASSSSTTKQVLSGAMKLKKMLIPVTALVGVTALSGAFVAGNDAGRVYNTFPKMGDHWVPPFMFELEPNFRNFFENQTTVQFDHRVLATATLLSIGAVWWRFRGIKLPPKARKLLTGTTHTALLQVGLGISTLVMSVPVSLGVAHQAGALTLFTLILALSHSLL